ncbi:hypothetical protein RvY_17114 [Ramazzottius varieornatus]|uniref:Uncharacterized protein n=1 Tax=Ramazzottius varieornatus TaxID=947166 RepID=A0A1D1W3D3_RAMVA|nr:hypothetical protein RvY_17114 [Ramazzottius varieornatus]
MGCGLSQLSGVQRARVSDISSKSCSQKSTSVDNLLNNNVNTGNPSRVETSVSAPVTVAAGSKRPSIDQENPHAQGQAQLEEAVPSRPRSRSRPLSRHADSPSADLPVDYTVSHKPSIASNGSDKSTKSFSGPLLAMTRPGTSSGLSNKSHSDDSGYRDDSLQPSEEEGGLGQSQGRESAHSPLAPPPKLTIEPSQATANTVRTRRSMFFDEDDEEEDDEYDDELEAESSMRVAHRLQPAAITASMARTYHHRPPTPWTNRRLASVGSELSMNDSVDGLTPRQPGLCTCGFSHQKPDGYVETYGEHEGYLDSSYEELRSLARDGSVFSLDIMCHTNMEGSLRPRKIPLQIHKPTSAPAGPSNSTETNATVEPAKKGGTFHTFGDFQRHFQHSAGNYAQFNRSFKYHYPRDPSEVFPMSALNAAPPVRRRRLSSSGSRSGIFAANSNSAHPNTERLPTIHNNHPPANLRSPASQDVDDFEIKSLHE